MNKQLVKDLEVVCTITPNLGYNIWKMIEWAYLFGKIKTLQDLDKVRGVGKKRKALLIAGYNKLKRQDKGK